MTTFFTTNILLVLLNVAYMVTVEDLKDGTLIQLEEGKIRGHIMKSGNGNDYYAFQEIPYAAPPIGKNRFQKPSSNSAKLPVLVWIHGGGFKTGSGIYEQFGPKYIMDHGIIVVTMNYRLGPFGFGTTEDDIIPANVGLKDQVFALEWINKNIHLFAGDSKQVTISGSSAGSISSGLHILGQKENKRDLFRAAIMQSGSPLFGLAQGNVREVLFNCGRILDNNFNSNASSDLLKVLQKATSAAILAACSGALSISLENEGDFSYAPLQSFIDGNFGKVPILIGFNSEEFIIFANANETELTSYDNDPGKLLPVAINLSPKNRTIAGKLLKTIYTNTSFKEDVGAYIRWTSDNYITTPISKFAEVIASQVPVYLYQFSHYGPMGRGPRDIVPGTERVAHGAELPYMWDDGSNSDLSQYPEEDRITLHRLIRMWTNFVKYRNPTPQYDSFLDNFTWSTTDSETLRYLNFNDTLEMKKYPRQYKDVKKIRDYYMDPPYNYY